MRSTNLFIVSYVFISLLLGHVQSVEAQKIKLCPATFNGPGVCGHDGSKTCKVYIKIEKKSRSHCNCREYKQPNVPVTRFCNCEVPC
uniref:SCR protein n=1 Tax=Capsella grandiflora TaxID=264402 RepID=A0A330PQY1_9BRAS|nr:SCR [Capsella grandiflora]